MKNTHGCCADKVCNDQDCMELPVGKTCGHCVHERRCCMIFGHTPTDTYCDWFPRRFIEKPAPQEAKQTEQAMQKALGDHMHARMDGLLLNTMQGGE